jgi:hypothetical protein
MNESSIHWTTTNLTDTSLVPGMNHELALSLTHPSDVSKFRNVIWGKHMAVGGGDMTNMTFDRMRDHFRTCDEFVKIDLDSLL